MTRMQGLTVALTAAIATSVMASFAHAARKSASAKSCMRTAGGYTVCHQGNQTCTYAPDGHLTYCMTPGSGPPPTQPCTVLPDGTRICITQRR